MRSFHEWWGWGTVVANALAGAWSLGAHWIEALRVRALWWGATAAQLSIFVAVVSGVVLTTSGDVEATQLHMFYGFVAAITVGLLYSYRAQLERQRYLLYGLGGLFLMGLVLRAIQLSGRS